MSLHIQTSPRSPDFAQHFVVGGSSSTAGVYEVDAAAPNAHDTFTDTQPAAIQNPQVASAESAEIESVGGSETVATDEAPVLHAELQFDWVSFALGSGLTSVLIFAALYGVGLYDRLSSPYRFIDSEVKIRNLPRNCNGLEFTWCHMDLLTALEIRRRGGGVDLTRSNWPMACDPQSIAHINRDGLQGAQLSAHDIKFLRARGVTNFDGADLRGVLFYKMDLRGINWGNAKIDPKNILLEKSVLDDAAKAFFKSQGVKID